jgi:hypothetical protein
MKVNLALIIKNMDSGNETIYDLPMPMTEQVYDGQPWFPVGLFDRVYYWGDLAVVSTSGPLPSLTDSATFDIEIPALDLMEYIRAMATYIPGSQIPLLALGIAVDYNLYMDIDLQFEIVNTGNISMILLASDSGDVLQPVDATIAQSPNETIDYYSYSITDSSIDILGSIGLRLRIAQPGWLTTSLGFFYEDPMFLEGIWEYTISESDGPLASSNGMVAELANTSVSISILQATGEDNTSSDDTGNNSTTTIDNNTNNSSNDNGETNNSSDGPNNTTLPSDDADIIGDSGKDGSPSLQTIVIAAGVIICLLGVIIVTALVRKRL